MSIVQLSEKIYQNKDARSGITKWVNALLKEGVIKKGSKGFDTSKNQYYKIDIRVLGKFTKQEYNFIQLVIERFWNPVTSDPFRELSDFLIGLLTIKKISKLKGTIMGHNTKKDLDWYNLNKKKFWQSKNDRDDFLNKIHKKSNNAKNRPFHEYYLRRDLVFVSLLIPDTILSKLALFDKSQKNPTYLTICALKS
jgi:hypothetical protein